uniref:Uncharacterized protein n=1 Tax=Heterorhabditis bacteriophora TaxID=37862 RepID=A0A1I7WG21_HETBA
MKKYPELTQAHKNERLCWIRIFVKCDLQRREEVQSRRFCWFLLLLKGFMQGTPTHSNQKFRWRNCYGLESIWHQQRGLPGCLRTSSSPVSPTISSEIINRIFVINTYFNKVMKFKLEISKALTPHLLEKLDQSDDRK